MHTYTQKRLQFANSPIAHIQTNIQHTHTKRLQFRQWCDCTHTSKHTYSIYVLKAYSQVNYRTGSPQGFSLDQNLQKLNTIQNTNVKPIFGIALVIKWQIKLGDAVTTDRFGLAFQYQIFNNIYKRTDKNNPKLKIHKCIKTNTSAIWQHMLHIPPTKVLIS